MKREQYLIQQDTHAHPPVLVSIAAPEDNAWLTQWETHPQQEGRISVWPELHLTAGTDRVQEFQRQIDGADLVVPLHRLAQLMGHDSLDTTILYVQGTKEDLQQAVETIAWT